MPRHDYNSIYDHCEQVIEALAELLIKESGQPQVEACLRYIIWFSTHSSDHETASSLLYHISCRPKIVDSDTFWRLMSECVKSLSRPTEEIAWNRLFIHLFEPIMDYEPNLTDDVWLRKTAEWSKDAELWRFLKTLYKEHEDTRAFIKKAYRQYR